MGRGNISGAGERAVVEPALSAAGRAWSALSVAARAARQGGQPPRQPSRRDVLIALRRERLFDELRRLAERRQSCPENVELAARLGCGRVQINDDLRWLEARGRIKTSGKKNRVVHLLHEGLATAPRVALRSPAAVPQPAGSVSAARRESLYAELLRLARAGAECPPAPELARRIGGAVEGIYEQLRALARAGRVELLRRHRGRIHVTVVVLKAEGLRTAEPARLKKFAGAGTIAANAAAARGEPDGRGQGTSPRRPFVIGPQAGTVIPDHVLYGEMAAVVLALRQAGDKVLLSQTLGHPPGQYVLNGTLVGAAALPQRLERLQRRVVR